MHNQPAERPKKLHLLKTRACFIYDDISFISILIMYKATCFFFKTEKISFRESVKYSNLLYKRNQNIYTRY